MSTQPENEQKSRNRAAEGQQIAVRIVWPLSEQVARLAKQEKRPLQWQVDLLLREGLKAIGQTPDLPD